MRPLLIRNGWHIGDEGIIRKDLLIENGIISRNEPGIEPAPEMEIEEASGKWVLPGGFDPHVHMSLPSAAGLSCDDFRSGSMAALAGGTTSMMDFVTPQRGESLVKALDKRRREAENCLINIGFHVGITWWSDQLKNDIRDCIIHEGIHSFKTYLAYRNTIGIDYDELEMAMRIVGEYGGIMLVHCEDGEEIERLQNQYRLMGLTEPKYHALSRPPRTESAAVRKVVDLCRKTSCPVYIVHVSAAESLEEIRRAKDLGIPVFAETCPHYLLLDDSLYDQPFRQAAPYVLSPPLRRSADCNELRKALEDGTIDTIGTDHCPFNLEGQKDQGLRDFTRIPNGAGSIEYRLPLIYTIGVISKRISVQRFIALLCSNPANIFKQNHKGTLDAAKDADIILWDPQKRWVIRQQDQVQRCDSNIYEGYRIQGGVERVYLKGKKAVSGTGRV